MQKKLVKLIFLFVCIMFLSYIFVVIGSQSKDKSINLIPIQITKGVEKLGEIIKNPSSIFDGKETLNILLIGIDRRSKDTEAFNTDVMMLVSVNTKTNKVLMTSVPRDLWINDNKINALYTVYGYETLKDAFEKITGLKVDAYIRCDFEDFKWIADSFGGIPIDVERTFTDDHFPNNSDTGILSVTFTEGTEKMSGERALTFARSRKGTNGEGSDLMRAKRQQLLLKGMIKAISQPESIFWPMDINKFYSAVTAANKMKTDLTLDDTKYIWDLYNDRDKYEIKSFVVDGTYIYHPGLYPESPFHAWVFIPREGGLEKLHQDIQNKLNGAEPAEAPAVSAATPQVVSAQGSN